MKAALALLVLSSLLGAQITIPPSIPFSMSGSGMSVEGSIATATNTMSGTATLHGQSGTIGPCTPHLIGVFGVWWRCDVAIDGKIYTIWIGSTTGALGGYWFPIGSPTDRMKLI